MARSHAQSFNAKRRRSARSDHPVQLSKHDLSQLDAEALAALSHAQLQGLSEKLLADLKLAHERLDQRPHNSSRPPSSQAPGERGRDDGHDATDQEDRSESASPASSADEDADPPADSAEGSQPAASAQPSSTGAEAQPTQRPGQRPGAPAMVAPSASPSPLWWSIIPRTGRAVARISKRRLPAPAIAPTTSSTSVTWVSRASASNSPRPATPITSAPAVVVM